MSNLNIENIGRIFQTGDIESMVSNGRQVQSPVAPEIPGQKPVSEKGFGDLLSESLEKANEIQMQADSAAKEMIAGKNKNIHETMLMLEKADMSFRLMMQVRNKIIDAYREIMRMQT